MESKGKTVEFFIPSLICGCLGPVNPKDAEKITRLERLMSQVEEECPSARIKRYAMAEEECYAEGLRRLASYLKMIGEDDFASRVAFSLRYVLPAVAVEGKLVAYGRVPDLEEVRKALGEGEAVK